MSNTKREPLADIAPYPTRPEDATAAALIKRYAAFGEMHSRIGGEFGIDHDQWKTSIGHVVSSFTTVYLLTEIRDRLGVAAADEIARELWEHWEGGALPPWLWEWCDEEGLDHDAIAAAARQVAANIRANQPGESR
jgi:hypothetical protein